VKGNRREELEGAIEYDGCCAVSAAGEREGTASSKRYNLGGWEVPDRAVCGLFCVVVEYESRLGRKMVLNLGLLCLKGERSLEHLLGSFQTCCSYFGHMTNAAEGTLTAQTGW
jgi:hypothetical protein